MVVVAGARSQALPPKRIPLATSAAWIDGACAEWRDNEGVIRCNLCRGLPLERRGEAIARGMNRTFNFTVYRDSINSQSAER
jgi:hypothetical protein